MRPDAATTHNGGRHSADAITDLPTTPSDQPDPLTTQEFTQAKAMAQLSESERQFVFLDRLMARMDGQLDIVRGERDEAEQERDKLRGGAVGQWFQLLGAILMAVGMWVSRYDGRGLVGLAVFGCGVIVQLAGLIVPRIVTRRF